MRDAGNHLDRDLRRETAEGKKGTGRGEKTLERRPGAAHRNQLGRQLRIADRASTNRSVGLFELPRFSGVPVVVLSAEALSVLVFNKEQPLS